MQYLPDAADLLAAIGDLLDDRVLAAVPPDLQHHVRVAAHLSELLAREAALGDDNTANERRLIAGLLGAEHDDPVAALDDAIGAGDVDLEVRAWSVLVEIARRDLAICKPGHDAYEGR